ncbi:hypothetical protein F1643_03735 [Azospirillum sp. INR13]|uniref:HEPN domain-containing protein n=1 Tax=Azospirillum sp. INR13 TaxID=2596919 RepID=UPI00189209A8|nr:HEPN domain-containing protein [Azospirillum sp. INR13]MBF5093736.1 hypothetical protein [Azospirillum sp. INR13]
MNDRPRKSAIELLEGAATELAEIHRGKHYGPWRQEAAQRLSNTLAQVEPFSNFCNVWIYTGDSSGIFAGAQFGEWAIDLLVEKKTPEAILAAFLTEVERNAANYSDMSPVLGVQINVRCDLGDGVTLVPEPGDVLASLMHRSTFQPMLLPTGTSLLCQSCTVTPAFERGGSDEFKQGGPSITAPDASHRDAARKRVRLACLLASAGPVELPLTVLRPDRRALFVGGKGNWEAQPFAARPLVSYPVEAAAVTRAFELLGRFREVESLTRAIDRLGRARLAASPVDRALELGIAAEIALMHDHSPANTEITHKIGGRAAWLLGRDPAEREAVFVDLKKLYQARSQAVHSGALSSKSTVDLDAADQLVTRVLSAILERGSFPNWNNLTMGGNGR